MKKWLTFLLAWTIVAGLSGCHGTTPDPSYAPLVMTPGETHSSYPGVEIQLDSLDWIEGNHKSSLAVIWNNSTQYQVTYGASFAIERLDGEEWVSCAFSQDTVFIAIGYLLPAGTTRKETYTLTDLFDIRSPGVYRFKTDCYVACSDKEIKCLLTAEFSLGSANLSPESISIGTVIAPVTKPPKGTLITPDGEAALVSGGYHWIYVLDNGIESATIADQAIRPPSKELLTPVTIPNPYAEIIDTLGCLVQPVWEIPPTNATYTCWPDTVWLSSIPEESVMSQSDFSFYAKPGGYVYEIVATWDDTGAGYHGTVNYYVYIQY